jgi:Ni/Co efflux regulator RcnB
MRRLVAGLVAAAVALTATAPAIADPPQRHGKYGHHDDRGYRDRDRDRHDRYDRYDRYGRHDRDYDNRDDRRDERYAYWRGYSQGYRDDWRSDWRYTDRGRDDWRWSSDRYRWAPGHYVHDYARYPVIHNYYGYRGYRLPPPGRGQYYIDRDGEILLVAAATGLIIWALTQ